MPGGTLARLNTAVDGLIAMGRYREALQLPRDWVPKGADTESGLLVQINLAEAEYNLGDWGAAWERLRGLDPLAAAFPIARAGLSQQRAWIAAHTDRAEEALHHWHRAELHDLPRRYHAEHCFTGAVALLAAGDLEGALCCASRGTGVAMRTSSGRNGLFIQARIAAAAGDWPRAESLCHAGALHPCAGRARMASSCGATRSCGSAAPTRHGARSRSRPSAIRRAPARGPRVSGSPPRPCPDTLAA